MCSVVPGHVLAVDAGDMLAVDAGGVFPVHARDVPVEGDVTVFASVAGVVPACGAIAAAFTECNGCAVRGRGRLGGFIVVRIGKVVAEFGVLFLRHHRDGTKELKPPVRGLDSGAGVFEFSGFVGLGLRVSSGL